MWIKEKTSKGLNRVKETATVCARLISLVWNTDKKLFIGATIAIAVPGVVPFINIYIYKLVIDLVVSTVTSSVFDPTKFYPLIALRVATYFGQDVAFRTQDYAERLLWTKVPIELNNVVFKKVSSLDIEYFENDKFRDLVEKVRESIGHRPQQLMGNILYTFQSLIQFTIALVAIVNLNSFFIFLVAAVAIPEFIHQTYQSKVAWGIWSDQSPFKKRFGYLNHLLFHHREVKEIKIFALAQKLIKEARTIQEKFYLDNKKVANKSYASSLVFNGLSTAVFVGIEVFVILEAIAKRITVGDINFYTGVVSNFQNGLGGLLRGLNNIFDQSLYVKTIFELLDVEPKIEQSLNPVKLTTNQSPTIEFKNVDFVYPGSSKKILKDFSLKIEKGEKMALVGENGAGKSTIIKLLLRFYDVTAGEILIDGVNVKQLDLNSWYQYVGVLFQDFNKYEDSVKENIYFGGVESDASLEKVIQASISAGSHQMIERFDKKYEQMLGRMFEGGLELSGGQWQKVALARAFFKNAPILILDEPTASIDAKAESEIFNKVEKLSKDKTVIIISHRFSTVRNADKIYVIDSGKIVESGSHESLMKLDGQYANLFKLQAKGYQ